MTKLIQSSLSGGEISTAVASRVDIAKYKSSVAKCENLIPQVHGGAASRTGLEFVCQAKDNATDVRLIPFEFNTTQTYILEFGNLYMRVIKDGGQVLSSTQKTISAATRANPCVVTATSHGYASTDTVHITEVVGMTQLNGRTFNITVLSANTFSLQDLNDNNINSSAFTAYGSAGKSTEVFQLTTPYTTAVLFDLDYVQSADVMTLCHPDFSPRELSRTDHNAWTLAEIAFYPAQAQPTGIGVSATATGSEVYKYTVTAVNVETSEESLRGTGATVSISAATAANPCVVTSATHSLAIGDEVAITGVVGMTELNNRRYRVGAVPSSTTIELQDTGLVNVDSSGFTAYSSGGTLATAYTKITNGHETHKNVITWTAAASAATYNVYRQFNGIFGFVGRTELLTFTDDNIDPDLEDTPPKIRNPFIGTNNFPSTVGFFQQRRVFANTNTHPQRIFLTQTANLSNLAASSPAKGDDAIIITIASRQVNEIRHLIPLNQLVILTSGGEWILDGVEGIISPATAQITPQTYYGATSVKPILAGSTVLYVEAGTTIRDLGYRYETDTYSGNDVSILARHLFDDYTIIDWAFLCEPDSVVFGVRDDGILVSMTYLREQEVFGWSRHTTKGLFKSVASVQESAREVLYAVVEREINSQTVRYIERMHSRSMPSLQDAFFVDSGLTLDTPITITGYTSANPIVITATGHGLSNGDKIDLSDIKEKSTTETEGWQLATGLNGTGYTVADKTTNTFELQNEGVDVNGSTFAAYHSGGKVRLAATAISGLWHLEGETVSGLANGSVITPLTVASGAVTLPTAASRVHLGLPYTCELQTLRINVTSGSNETLQGQLKKNSRIVVRTEKTMGMYVGPDADSLREVKFGLPSKYGQPRELFEGDKATTLKPNWDRDGQFVIQQQDPVPLTILAVIPDAAIGGN